MNRQPEGTMTWSSYKNMMVTDERVDSGKQFISEYKKDLKRAEDIYGVPASIIASIIGIETRYGKITGNIRVLDSLSTLSFDYPRRAKFFKVQLEEFLLLAEEENWDPSNIKGSIAGAMGFGQFMPDSYRNYAVDFDFDGKRDILNNPVDAIGSVANFLNKKGKWEPNTKIVLKATHSGERPELKSSFKPYIKVSDLKSFGITPVEKLQNQLRVIPIELEIEKGYEYWLGLKNYQAISRYNRSKLYIMAVYEFSESLAEFF
jgi:membrane-bound lytic murein transglycosylase B